MRMEEHRGEIGLEVGADRVVSPPGVLPQPAEVLDPSGPVRAHEFEVAVERLCLDSTSHRQLAESCGRNPDRMAERILEIVANRGKMHNPATDSGGILTGVVAAVGDAFPEPPHPGDEVATLASLTLTPLRLDSVTVPDPESPQVEASGAAYVCASASWSELPPDLPVEKAVEVFDVCAAASHVRDLAGDAANVCVLGAGHGGKLALAAARDAAPDSTLTVVDIDGEAVGRLTDLGLADIGVVTDLREPLRAAEALRRAGAEPADLTVVVVNASGCEPAAILHTAESGQILFFSMATNFGTAALTSDGLSSKARMVIGSGFSPDRGAYALELLRRSGELRQAMEVELGAPA